MNQGMGQPGQQPMQLNIDPNTLEDVVCDCGHGLFEQRVKLKKVSALQSPSGREQVISMPALVCADCGAELGAENGEG